MTSSTEQSAGPTRRRRVPAMAPEDRRAALIDATIPLLHEYGVEVSTRQIAQAAGVAEGTIFGVFPDKNSLLLAAVLTALEPDPTLAALARIDPGAGLRARLAQAAELINARFVANAQLMTAARKLVIAPGTPPDAIDRMTRSRQLLQDALTAIVQPDAAMLRREPANVAALLLLFCGANTYGPFGDPDHFHGEELVSLLLDGLLIRPSTDHGGA
ncbi:TetR/AcrR family transcriptional regulator [Actinoplanes sp. N902-109]|uniref:TetR/AcrR family transcriptional regulator n=1 Tax=Actinoplanes sp. (strain N902-109) TaxID=649831 RepID=UPI00032955B2|nr:TetR/AcrR family transcriptional regulator [Actinoplanes sp. N902-109]AGL19967.1 TetR family transcriptional regulator [Actinoplanes sp. N902-109]